MADLHSDTYVQSVIEALMSAVLRLCAGLVLKGVQQHGTPPLLVQGVAGGARGKCVSFHVLLVIYWVIWLSNKLGKLTLLSQVQPRPAGNPGAVGAHNRP